MPCEHCPIPAINEAMNKGILHMQMPSVVEIVREGVKTIEAEGLICDFSQTGCPARLKRYTEYIAEVAHKGIRGAHHAK